MSGVKLVARARRDEEGVSAVVGTLLMLTITVVVFSALSISALEYFDRQEDPVRVDLGIVRGDAGVNIVHRGGDALEMSRGSLILNKDGVETTVPLNDPALDAQTDDLGIWRIGESLCLVGDTGSGCLYEQPPATQVLGVVVVYADRVIADEGDRAGLPLPVLGVLLGKRPRLAQTTAASRRARRNEEGVSSVVAASLVFALIITMTTLWSVQTAPDWVADREVEHQKDTVAALTAVRSGLDTLSAADDKGPLTVPVPMAAGPLPVMQRAPSQGTLEMTGSFAASGTFDSASTILVNGGTAGAPTDEVDGDVHTDVGSLNSLVLALSTSNVGNNDYAWVEVEVSNSTTSATIKFVHAGKQEAHECATTELRVEVTSDAGTYYTVLTCSESEDLVGRRVDALEMLYGFDAAVRALDGPLTMTLSDGSSDPDIPPTVTADATYSGVWTDSSGSVQASQGTAPAKYTFSQSGSVLRLDPRYQETSNQELRLEGGAIIRVQDDRRVIVTPSSFALEVDGAQGNLTWTLVETTGTGSLGGSGRGTVTATHLDTERVLFDAPDGEITLTTSSGDAWRRFLQDQVDTAGAGGSATVTGSGDTVTLTLGGGLTWRVDLRLVQAQVKVS